MNAAFVSHPAFQVPGFGKHHPLSINRQAAVLDLCEAMGWLTSHPIHEPQLPSRATLERFHTPGYLDAFESSARLMMATPHVRERYNLGTMECPLFAGVWDRARATVGGSILAAELALMGNVAFHPGGGTHHGRPGRAAGFCYLNDPVFAILRFLDAGLSRVLYVDLDAHHGDGVEAAFANDPRVTMVSIHEEGRWPGTGGISSPASKNAYNFPVPRHINDCEFSFLVDEVCKRRLNSLKPQAVVIICGADPLKGDPLSSMELSNATLWKAVAKCIALADHAVVLGGGGYNPWTTARAWAGLWAQLSGQPIPDRLTGTASSVLAHLSCDLIEDEDRNPAWLTTLIDPEYIGPVRTRIRDIADAVLNPTGA